MNIKLYRALSLILSPVIDLYLLYRKSKGKEDSERFHERIGKPSFPRPKGSLIWIHAASVGEAISILPLINKIKSDYQNLNILLTTGTVTSSKMLEKKLPRSIIHQYVPIDKYHVVKRFLNHWRPDCSIWVESEIWPNLIHETYSTGCPLLLVNARMSENSFEKWQKVKSFSENLLSCFSLCVAQSEGDAERFKKAGGKNVINVGNLKYEAPALPADPSETGKLVTMIADRPIWIAASTNKGEEELIAFVHKKLEDNNDKLLTIVIPRHPERAGDIKEVLEEKGLEIALRSKSEEISDKTSIYVADTIGEMGIFYRLSGIVFMGGSLVEHGGQNPLEAARLECAIISGNNVSNFKDIYRDLETQEGVIIVKDADDLAGKIDQLITDHDIQEKYAGNALDFVESKAGVLDKYMETLSPYLLPLEKNQTN